MVDGGRGVAKISIADLMELTLAVAVGLRATTWHRDAIRFWFFTISTAESLLLPYRVFVAAFALTLGFGLVIETIRRRGGARGWGLGRQTIAITGVYLLFMLVDELGFSLLKNTYTADSAEQFWGDAGLTFSNASDWLSHFIVSVWLVALVMGQRVKMRADSREWVGRGIAAALVAFAVAKYFL